MMSEIRNVGIEKMKPIYAHTLRESMTFLRIILEDNSFFIKISMHKVKGQ